MRAGVDKDSGEALDLNSVFEGELELMKLAKLMRKTEKR